MNRTQNTVVIPSPHITLYLLNGWQKKIVVCLIGEKWKSWAPSFSRPISSSAGPSIGENLMTSDG